MQTSKKVLFTAHIDSHILAFHVPYLKYFKDNGYTVHVASHGDATVPHADIKFDVPIERSPFKLNNLRAIKQLKEIIDRENYDIIHTHTPMGSVVTRLAAMAARKKGTRVIYTAHGLHFFKGAPLLNWIIYYPIEKLLAHKTDDLITINNEDYELAKTKFKTKVHYVPGVGIDPKKFDIKMTKAEKSTLRKSLGLKDDDFVMIYVAELSKRKNQMWLVKTLEEMMKDDKKVHLLLPGKDSLNGKLHELVKNLGLESQVHLLGFRSDIPQLMKISDMAVSAAKQEGLPVNLMEAMHIGLPIVATDCRGNRDLVIDGETGFTVPTGDSVLFAKKVEDLHASTKLCTILGEQGRKEVRKYIFEDVLDSIENIYRLPDKQSTEPIRVLQVVTSMNRAGLETMLMNYYRHIDRSKVQFDFLVHRQKEGAYEKEIRDLGGRIYRFDPISLASIPGYAHRMKNFLLSHPEYKIIHSHLDALSMLPLKGAKKAGTPTRIAHSHNNGFSRDAKLPLRYFYKSKIKRYATHFFACSDEAGRFMFGKGIDFHVLRNAINLSEYTFNREERERLRTKLGICEDEFVIGHVGRLTDQKNQKFLLRVLHMIQDRKSSTKLILIGEGEDRAALQGVANALNVSNRVLFLGSRPDVSSLLSAMDVFALPSKYEGLGIAAIEAQVNGLPVVLSTNTSIEAALSDQVEYLPIDSDDVNLWSESIIGSRRLNSQSRVSILESATSRGYDINREVDSLVDFYVS